MEHNDHELESFLREFAPRPPRPLPVTPVDLPSHPIRWYPHRLAAAVLLTLAGGASVWLATRQNTPIPFPAVPAIAVSSKSGTAESGFPSQISLERLALEDPEQFDATMCAASRRMLRHVNNSVPTLRALAKD